MKYIYTFYIWIIGLLLFGVITCFSIVALSFVSAEKFSPTFKFLTRFLVKLLFIRVKVSGTEHFNKNNSCIIMANHVSFFDALFLTAFSPFYTIGIEDQSHFKWPLYGILIRKHGNLPIDRKSSLSSKRTYQLAEQKLKNGSHLIIFPEGGRTTDGNLRPFKKLPFMLAQNAGCEIIPLGMSGIFEMNNKNSWLINPIRINMHYGNPIPAKTVTSLTNQELLELTRAKIVELLEK